MNEHNTYEYVGCVFFPPSLFLSFALITLINDIIIINDYL